MKKLCKTKECENEFVQYSTLQNKCDECRKKQINSVKKVVKVVKLNQKKVSEKTKRLKVGESEFAKNSKLLKDVMIEYFGYVFCEKCKKSNGMKYECHHLFFRSEKVGHKNLHNIKNLIILCNYCHNEAHEKKEEWRKELVEERGLKELFN